MHRVADIGPFETKALFKQSIVVPLVVEENTHLAIASLGGVHGSEVSGGHGGGGLDYSTTEGNAIENRDDPGPSVSCGDLLQLSSAAVAEQRGKEQQGISSGAQQQSSSRKVRSNSALRLPLSATAATATPSPRKHQ